MKFWSDIANRYGGIARVPLMKGHVTYLVSEPGLALRAAGHEPAQVPEEHPLSSRRRAVRPRLAAQRRRRLEAAAAHEPTGVQGRLHRRAGAVDGRAHGQVPRALAAATPPSSAVRDVDADFLHLSQTARRLLPDGARLRAHRRAFLPRGRSPSRTAGRARRAASRSSCAAAATAGPTGSRRPSATSTSCIYEYLAAERRRDFAGAGLVKLLVDGSRAQGDEFDDRSLRDQILSRVLRRPRDHRRPRCRGSTICSTSTPTHARKLRAEVDHVLAAPRADRAPISIASTYTEQVINEALRLYSPIHSLSRVALDDDTLGGYHIPAGATIYVSLYATHRLPSLWPDPDRFDPDRFTKDAGRAPAALRVHSVRGRPPQLRRGEHGDRRAQAGRGDDRAALRAHSRAGPPRRRRGRHHDASRAMA